jgi:carbon-monoxide dehydrogenase medium subunit
MDERGGWSMKPAPFQYHRPETAEDVAELLAEHPDAELMAGNQSLGVVMSNRLATPDDLIDLNEVEDLRYVDVSEDAVEIGAMARHADLEHSTELAETLPLLPEESGHIAGPAVRNRGTVGGTLGEADPAGNHSCALLALDATIELLSADGVRTVPVEEYFLAYMMTAMEEEELIRSVRISRDPFPVDRTGMRFAVEKRAAQTWPTLGASAVIRVDDPGSESPVVETAGLSFANAADVPLRVPKAESALEGEPLSDPLLESVGDIVYEVVDPEDEMHADETYKRELAATFARRTVEDAYERAIHT